MTTLRNILIVDQGSIRAADLCDALQHASFKVHVVNNPASAQILIRSKRIHGAIIDRNGLAKCRTLCGELVESGIPYMFQGPANENVVDVIAALTEPDPTVPRFFQQV